MDLKREERIWKVILFRDRPKQVAPQRFLEAFEAEDWKITGEDTDADYALFLEKLSKCKTAAAAAVKVVKSSRTRLNQKTLAFFQLRSAMAAESKTGLEYKILCKHVQRLMKEDNYRQNKLKEAASQKLCIKRVYREIQVRQNLSVAFVDKTDRGTTNRRQMESICKDFFSQFSPIVTIESPIKQATSAAPDIEPCKVEHEVRSMNARKAAGIDKLRAGGKRLFKVSSSHFPWYFNFSRISAIPLFSLYCFMDAKRGTLLSQKKRNQPLHNDQRRDECLVSAEHSVHATMRFD
ncbi:unnamed protein product [Gongylonema pulchrum]|uniref:SNF2_N domain-containing protein n=1 Tax=Gongylonema pulchrum TaxID=637853 RepID=A0A183DRX0_9BILA|nr:unnamed protein product [Gongylonema pulchrum]